MLPRTFIAAAGFAAVAIASAVTRSSAQAPAGPAGAPVSFASDILPVMEATRLSCHGADNQLGGLDLRSRDAAIRGGDHGTALVPGNAEQSRLFRMISGREQPAMRNQWCRGGGGDRGRSGRREAPSSASRTSLMSLARSFGSFRRQTRKPCATCGGTFAGSAAKFASFCRTTDSVSETSSASNARTRRCA